MYHSTRATTHHVQGGGTQRECLVFAYLAIAEHCTPGASPTMAPEACSRLADTTLIGTPLSCGLCRIRHWLSFSLTCGAVWQDCSDVRVSGTPRGHHLRVMHEARTFELCVCSNAFASACWCVLVSERARWVLGRSCAAPCWCSARCCHVRCELCVCVEAQRAQPDEHKREKAFIAHNDLPR